MDNKLHADHVATGPDGRPFSLYKNYVDKHWAMKFIDRLVERAQKAEALAFTLEFREMEARR